MNAPPPSLPVRTVSKGDTNITSKTGPQKSQSTFGHPDKPLPLPTKAFPCRISSDGSSAGIFVERIGNKPMPITASRSIPLPSWSFPGSSTTTKLRRKQNSISPSRQGTVILRRTGNKESVFSDSQSCHDVHPEKVVDIQSNLCHGILLENLSSVARDLTQPDIQTSQEDNASRTTTHTASTWKQSNVAVPVEGNRLCSSSQPPIAPILENPQRNGVWCPMSGWATEKTKAVAKKRADERDRKVSDAVCLANAHVSSGDTEQNTRQYLSVGTTVASDVPRTPHCSYYLNAPQPPPSFFEEVSSNASSTRPQSQDLQKAALSIFANESPTEYEDKERASPNTAQKHLKPDKKKSGWKRWLVLLLFLMGSVGGIAAGGKLSVHNSDTFEKTRNSSVVLESPGRLERIPDATRPTLETIAPTMVATSKGLDTSSF
jgi:hypothetical protein